MSLSGCFLGGTAKTEGCQIWFNGWQPPTETEGRMINVVNINVLPSKWKDFTHFYIAPTCPPSGRFLMTRLLPYIGFQSFLSVRHKTIK